MSVKNNFKAHLFICTQTRADGESCGANLAGAQALRDQIKKLCKAKWPTQVRVNSAGCLGQCEKGIAAVLYPSGKWYFHLTEQVIPKILEDIENLARE